MLAVQNPGVNAGGSEQAAGRAATKFQSASRIVSSVFISPRQSDQLQNRVQVGNTSVSRGVEYVGSATGTFAGTPSASVTVPGATQPGDLLVLCIGADDLTDATHQRIFAEEGWVRVSNDAITDPQWLTLFYRVYTDDDPSTFSLSSIYQVNERAAVGLLVYRNADLPTESFLLTNTTEGSLSTSHTFPANPVTVEEGGVSLLVFGYGRSASPSVGQSGTGPSDWTELIDLDDNDAVDDYGYLWAGHRIYSQVEVDVLSQSFTTAIAARGNLVSIVINPLNTALRVWSGEEASETAMISNRGVVFMESIVGDLTVGGVVRSKLPYFAQVSKNANQSLGTSGVAEKVTFAAHDWDHFGMWDDAGDRFSITSTHRHGLYLIKGKATFASNSTGARDLRISQNAVTDRSRGRVAASSSGVTTVETEYLYWHDGSATNHFTLWAEQTSGGSLQVLGDGTPFMTWFNIMYLGDV